MGDPVTTTVTSGMTHHIFSADSLKSKPTRHEITQRYIQDLGEIQQLHKDGKITDKEYADGVIQLNSDLEARLGNQTPKAGTAFTARPNPSQALASITK